MASCKLSHREPHLESADSSEIISFFVGLRAYPDPVSCKVMCSSRQTRNYLDSFIYLATIIPTSLTQPIRNAACFHSWPNIVKLNKLSHYLTVG